MTPTHPPPVRRAILANLLAAWLGVCLLLSGYLRLAPDITHAWQIVIGLAVWMLGITGLWWGRRWGWYLTLISAVLFALAAMTIGYVLVFFHSVPTLRSFVRNPETIAILGGSLLPWVMVAMLFHPEVRRFVRQPRPTDDIGLLPGPIRRRLTTLALVALLPAAGLASRPVLVHRSMVDETEPGYTSNYLRGRGLLFPWIVTEEPYDMSVGWLDRFFPMNLLALYMLCFSFVATPYLALVGIRAALRPRD